ncbi:MAG TPA: hypothetical protein VM888_02875, partial [Chitinophagaceae bacterium]|nr:hypothetical protein [Chitinophagaceae bacterium]
MTRNALIILKAALLLVVFAMNTIICFACTIGMGMSFNTKHHDRKNKEAAIHIHKDGKQHVHYEEKNIVHHNKSNHDDQENKQPNTETGKKNCCIE